jgi:hypothetical protein
MALFGRIDGSEPIREDANGPAAGIQEERRTVRSSHLGIGTLACPVCDAPVALADGPVAPADPLFCPVCEHTAPVRDFLSLSQPTRPARVAVRLVAPAVP